MKQSKNAFDQSSPVKVEPAKSSPVKMSPIKMSPVKMKREPSGRKPLDHLQKLRKKGYLQDVHLEAGLDIRRIAERVVTNSTGGFEIASLGMISEEIEQRYRSCWRVWIESWSSGHIRWHRKEAGRKRHIAYLRERCLGVTLDLLLGRDPIRQVEQRYGLRAGHGKLIFKLMLTHYAELMGIYPGGKLAPWLEGGAS